MLTLCLPARLAVALLLVASCAHPQTIPERSPPAAALPGGSSDRIVKQVIVPAQKIEGGAAVLTAEGREAGVEGLVKAKCIVSLRGVLHHCRLPDELPLPQQHAIWLALEQWRFSPARHGGIAVAAEYDLDVPLAPPPPGWSLPQASPLLLRSATPARPKAGGGSLPEGLDPPRLLSGPRVPAYTREALERGIEGRVRARCTLTEDGSLEDCDIIQSVPFLVQIVLAFLPSQHFTPALYEGKPQRMYYTLSFNFKLP